jgi:AraC-like DNA-binding protein
MKFKDFPIPVNVIAYAQDYSHGDYEAEHSHHCAQLLHTLSGVIRVETSLGSWVIPPNKGMWIPAGILHSLHITGDVKVRTLFIDPLARADLPNTCVVVDISPLLKVLIVEATGVPDERITGSRDDRIIELILDELRRLEGLSFHVPSPQSNELIKLCQHLTERISHPWTTADVAQWFKVSERTVLRKFQQELGLTFVEWLRQKRLLYALESLAMGNSVLDTALAIGYESPSAFSAMFKSRLGVSPRDYFPSLTH